MKATLLPSGERACESNGWIEYLKIKRQIDTLKQFSQAQKEDLEIELAKSNIEANKLNARIANQNEKDRKRNRIFLIINAVFAIINILIAALQLLKPIE